MHPDGIRIRVLVGVQLKMHAEVSALTIDGLGIEEAFDCVSPAIDRNGDEVCRSVKALVFHSQLNVPFWHRPNARNACLDPMLVCGVPDLPDAVAERTLRREFVPLPTQQLIDVVLNSPRSCRILDVLVEAQHKMGKVRIIPQALPPQSMCPRRPVPDRKLG